MFLEIAKKAQIVNWNYQGHKKIGFFQCPLSGNYNLVLTTSQITKNDYKLYKIRKTHEICEVTP